MNNKLDKQYTDLLQDILDNGVNKQTRNGEVLSVFSRQIRHNMKDGFPLLTTKKMHFKSIVVELMWFLKGDTNIKYLVDNGCHIWDGDAYKNYDNIQSTHHAINEARNMVNMMGSRSLESTKPLSQEEFINKIKIDDEFAKKWGELGPIYGKQWRDWNGESSYYVKPATYNLDYTVQTPKQKVEYTVKGIDQIQNLISELKTNPDSRRLMVNAWNVGELDQCVLPPCHYGFQVYTREMSVQERQKYDNHFDSLIGEYPDHHITLDKRGVPRRAISLMWSQRSVDTALGWPFNVASYGLLLELLGKMVNMIPDELICNLGDVHIYNNHIDGVKEQISREPYSLPKLNINTEWWPTESGECGVGPIDAQAVLRSFSDDNFCKCLTEEDIQLYDYQSHPKIIAPLSN